MLHMTLTLDQRKNILQREINRYVMRGYKIMSRTDTTARIEKKKNMGRFLLYPSRRNHSVQLSVDENGNVNVEETKQKP